MKSLVLSGFVAVCAAVSGVRPAAAAAEISDLRVAFELQEGGIFAREMIVVKARGEDDAAQGEVRIPLPAGARDAALTEEETSEGVALTDDEIVFSGPFNEAGHTAAITFGLEIADGRAVFDQRFGRRIALAHAAFVGENETIQLAGPGFGKLALNRTPSGFPAQFTVGQDFEDGHVRLEITGFDGNAMDRFSRLATILSFGMLAVGFAVWLKRRREG